MAEDDHNDSFNNLTAEDSFTDPSGTTHTGELADMDDIGSIDGDTRVDIEDDSGNTLVTNAAAIAAGDFIEFVDDGDNTVTLHADNTDTDTHVTVENIDGDALVSNVSRILAGNNLEFSDDGDGSVTLDASVTGPTVESSDTVTLTDGVTTIDTGISNRGAKVNAAIGVNTDANIDTQVYYDEDVGRNFLRIEEVGTTVGDPTVAYDVLHWGTTALDAYDDGGGGGGGGDTSYDALLDMEGGSITDYYTEQTQGTAFTITSDYSVSGTDALHGWIHNGNNWGANLRYYLGDEGLTNNADSLRQEFQFRIDSSVSMNSDENCRMWNSALADGAANSGGGGPPNGDDGWSERLYFTERGSRDSGTWNLLAYTYHMDGGQYGDLNTIEVSMETDTWHTIESYVQVNSYSGGSANADGIVRYKFNGTTVYEDTDLRFTFADDNRIQWGGPVLHYGGTYSAPSDVLVWYDDHKLWVNETTVN